MKVKSIAMVMATIMLVIGLVSGTLAWLTAKSDAVTNTFTASNINVTLTETTSDYKMIPGYDISKNPKAKVETGSEDCFLFVKIEKSSNFDTYLKYEIADGWTKLTGEGITDEIYYRITKNNPDTSKGESKIGEAYSVLKGDKVTVNDGVTKAQMNAVSETNKPTLTFTAYASQLHKNADEVFGAVAAWNNIEK